MSTTRSLDPCQYVLTTGFYHSLGMVFTGSTITNRTTSAYIECGPYICLRVFLSGYFFKSNHIVYFNLPDTLLYTSFRVDLTDTSAKLNPLVANIPLQ